MRSYIYYFMYCNYTLYIFGVSLHKEINILFSVSERKDGFPYKDFCCYIIVVTPFLFPRILSILNITFVLSRIQQTLTKCPVLETEVLAKCPLI